jgi:hypothetical protein
MADWLFFLDADGWLVGPESAPFPGEARVLNTALAALQWAPPRSDPEAALLPVGRDYDHPCPPVARRRAA